MSAAAHPFESQARLWLVAFVVSALVNVLVLAAIAFLGLARLDLRPDPVVPTPPEAVAVIIPQVVPAAEAGEEALAPARPPAPSFARTSPDQAEETPETPDFIGERNTRATSEGDPVAEAPMQPNQSGREPLSEDEVETTESRYQDGDLAQDRVAPPEATPNPARPSEATEPMDAPDAPEAAMREGVTEPVPPAREAERERLAEGPAPVERRVEDARPVDEPKPAVPERRSDGQKPDGETAEERPKPAANPQSPGFRGNQTKTRLTGSITRTGRSALNVEDSVLGRYHAAVSRAVEKEWQLNCVRNRDYITPGQLTMSFVLEASGKVRSVRVVDELQVGAIPKGFTLNAINDADIPAMPADLKKQLDGEPLELIYRFNF
jgi:hypothetical protein